MEESEKRRERLKAMRMEAARAGVYDSIECSGLPSDGLSNPLIEGEVASSAPERDSSPRFDFYTDPMSAYSANKRRNNFAPRGFQGYRGIRPRPNYPDMASSPAYQNSGVNSPGQMMFQSPVIHCNQGSSHGHIVGAASPLGNTASTWGGSGGSFNYSSSPNISRGVNFTNSGFGRGDSPYAIHDRGRGVLYSNSTSFSHHYDSGSGSSHYPDSGRGGGRLPSKTFSPGSGPYGRRGTGSHNSVSAELRPDLYYRKEMLEDPWKSLTPIIWKGLNSDKSWLPKSINVKKAKAASESSQRAVSQPSLAEYLATSFNETVDEPGS